MSEGNLRRYISSGQHRPMQIMPFWTAKLLFAKCVLLVGSIVTGQERGRNIITKKLTVKIALRAGAKLRRASLFVLVVIQGSIKTKWGKLIARFVLKGQRVIFPKLVLALTVYFAEKDSTAAHLNAMDVTQDSMALQTMIVCLALMASILKEVVHRVLTVQLGSFRKVPESLYANHAELAPAVRLVALVQGRHDKAPAIMQLVFDREAVLTLLSSDGSEDGGIVAKELLLLSQLVDGDALNASRAGGAAAAAVAAMVKFPEHREVQAAGAAVIFVCAVVHAELCTAAGAVDALEAAAKLKHFANLEVGVRHPFRFKLGIVEAALRRLSKGKG
eukprot:g2394.t1